MKCPRCGQTIDRLLNVENATIHWDFMLGDEDIKVVYNRHNEEYYHGDGDFRCPECQVELAYTEHDAINFLKGEISEEMAPYYLELGMKGGE